MTDADSDQRIDLPVETRRKLEDSLDVLIRSASDNGVEVKDMGFDLRNDDPEIPDVEVHIIQLENEHKNDR